MPSKATELRELPDEELVARIDAAKEELFNLRFQLATGQLDNPSRLRQVRHDLARVNTVLRELPDDELYVRIESAKEELFNLRFQLATGQLDNTARLKELRHDVARLATVLREREIELELDTIAARHALEDVAEEGGA